MCEIQFIKYLLVYSLYRSHLFYLTDHVELAIYFEKKPADQIFIFTHDSSMSEQLACKGVRAELFFIAFLPQCLCAERTNPWENPQKRWLSTIALRKRRPL